MTNKVSIGKAGEEIAAYCLIAKGWKILARNYKRKSDELDIIAKSDDGTLVFCEVKSFIKKDPISTLPGLVPEDNLTSEKLRKISRTCEFFARQHPELINEEKGWRIDLIAVDIGARGQKLDIRYYENIY